MMVRQWGWTEWDVYRFYNVDHPDYPNIPPPPNPTGLQLFMMACLEVQINQMNNEADPEGTRKREQREKQRENDAMWDQVKNRGPNSPY